MERSRNDLTHQPCRLLRWKSMFFNPGINPSDEPCWCIHTQKPLGPDGQVATPETCAPGRSCYEGD